MLLYEKIAFEDSIKVCESIEIKTLIEGKRTSICDKAKVLSVDEREFCRQIRLHAPRFLFSNFMDKYFLAKKIYPIMESIFTRYSKHNSSYKEKCGANKLNIALVENEMLLVKKEINKNFNASIIKKVSKFDKYDTIANLNVQSVDATISEILENKLHYLHSFREDAKYRFGLFIDGYTYPICYASFAEVDREDKVRALQESLGFEMKNPEIIELSRVFGCEHLPKNAISFLVAASLRYLGKYKYLITAINHNLGFTGKSMLSAGFIPYAFRPVRYAYDINGYYITKRGKYEVSKVSPNKMPPNVLYVRELKSSGKSKRIYCKLIKIGNETYTSICSAIEPLISGMRTELEKIWDERTRYHGTVFTSRHRPSKGQCGVSSLHLARKLWDDGHEALFCEGNVEFEKKKEISIDNHCWVIVKNYLNRKKDVVIDLTADQNGYNQKIIFKEKEELVRLRILYISKSEKVPHDIDVEHLLDRLDYLESKMLPMEEL